MRVKTPQVITAPEKQSIFLYPTTKIFLGGTIDMGLGEDWQAEAVEYFKDR